MSDRDTPDALGITPNPDLPTTRKQKTTDGDYAHADRETLNEELLVVAERHEGPLSYADIVSAMLNFADAYAEVLDVTVDVREDTAPDGSDGTLVAFPDDDVTPVPIGRWRPDTGDSPPVDLVNPPTDD